MAPQKLAGIGPLGRGWAGRNCTLYLTLVFGYTARTAAARAVKQQYLRAVMVAERYLASDEAKIRKVDSVLSDGCISPPAFCMLLSMRGYGPSPL